MRNCNETIDDTAWKSAENPTAAVAHANFGLSAENISWRLTKLLHVFPDEDTVKQGTLENDYDLLLRSEAAHHA